ncbi:HD family phosphohydrolase [Bacillus aquiflavi]|uniref:HD family phosphohydrolase n=1 Tax=Bacillus aquiflavi TaxID=2672567 RepID=UPI001CAA04D9|nr:HD family phosphohydrolase [Bacillus aquiflavi]UAC47291.1 HD family phosphohydrolase [Bacillus aquiflavi]
MKNFQRQFSKIRNLLEITFFRIVLFILVGAILYGAMFSNIKPEKLDLNLFSIAEKTIRSPITIEDKESTEKKRREALDQVQDVYTLKKEYTQNRVDLITSIFQSASEVNEEIREELERANRDGNNTVAEPPINEKLKRLKAKLTENVAKDISDPVFLAILQASKDELSIAKDLTVTAINNMMSNRIPADEVENAKKRVEEELKYTSLSGNLKNAAIELGRYAIIQNEFYDSAATEELRQQTIESIDPVKVLQGQIIVEEGQLISRDVYRQLELVGMLDNENSFQPFFGLGVLIFVLLSAVYYYFFELDVPNETKQNYLLLYSLVLIIATALMKTISLFQAFDDSEIGYIFPAAMGTMIIKILIDERPAILLTIMMAVCGSIIFNGGFTGTFHISIGIYILCSGLAGVLFLSKHNHRSKILQAGLFVSAVNVVVILSLIFLQNGQYSGFDYGLYFTVALISGIASAVLTIGFLPFFEVGFGILSTMKLIELSNPNHPLLRKILTEAPGTYHHSIMVANLAETACEAIGANGLLARVGCYYHDIGKTKRPQFFIENQMNIENPHDRLNPKVSRNIIIAHATDGADMLRKHRMPKEIVDIAEQHHGTTLLKFFYHKVKESEEDVKEEDYRYPGPKPQSKEAAIIGIADSVEAAVRSMSHPTSKQIEQLVKQIIADRLQDGQFNECDITLKELTTVSETLCATLNGIFHSRIEYPEMTKQKVKEA